MCLDVVRARPGPGGDAPVVEAGDGSGGVELGLDLAVDGVGVGLGRSVRVQHSFGGEIGGVDGVGDALGCELVGESGGVSEQERSVCCDLFVSRAAIADRVPLDLEHLGVAETKAGEIAVGLLANGAASSGGGDDAH